MNSEHICSYFTSNTTKIVKRNDTIKKKILNLLKYTKSTLVIQTIVKSFLSNRKFDSLGTISAHWRHTQNVHRVNLPPVVGTHEKFSRYSYHSLESSMKRSQRTIIYCLTYN